MGVPRQEYFIEEQWERLGARVAIGVGGSFDVIAGIRKRAPRFAQKLGLEWAYRLAQEPRRLFMRYLVTNSQFLGLIAWDPIVNAVRSLRPAWRGQ
jgi:N-acetylglucosaminyldiphosphoundecaprenol N-acetyl-beta-D-mannosaminyltransferase